MIIDGAMLQRASSVVSKTLTDEVQLNFLLVPELPHGSSGKEAGNGISTTDEATRVFAEFMEDVPMVADASGCDDHATCNGKVMGPGVAVRHCNSTTWPITPHMLHSPNATSWGMFHEVTNNSGSSAHMGVSLMMDNSIFLVQLLVGVATEAKPAPEETIVDTGMTHWSKDGGEYIFREGSQDQPF